MRAVHLTSLGLLAFAACGDNLEPLPSENLEVTDDPGLATDAPPSAPEPNQPNEPNTPVAGALYVRVVAGDGEPVTDNVFDTKDQVHFRLYGMATAGDHLDAPYSFRVLDLHGNVLSNDDDACRRFHVNASGRISMVLPGTQDGEACEHAFGYADNLSVVPQIAPFLDGEDDSGVLTYVVEVSPEGHPEVVLTDMFQVRVPQPPPCE